MAWVYTINTATRILKLQSALGKAFSGARMSQSATHLYGLVIRGADALQQSPERPKSYS